MTNVKFSFPSPLGEARKGYASQALPKPLPKGGEFQLDVESPSINLSGINGTSLKLTPVAFSIALSIAGAGPSIGNSPIPFAPPGPYAYGFSVKYTRIGGMSAGVGMM